MTAEKIIEIKRKIEDLKNKKARAEGVIEKIIDQLQKDHNVNSIEEAKYKIEQINNEIELNQKRLNQLGEKLESITDWSQI